MGRRKAELDTTELQETMQVDKASALDHPRKKPKIRNIKDVLAERAAAEEQAKRHRASGKQSEDSDASDSDDEEGDAGTVNEPKKHISSVSELLQLFNSAEHEHLLYVGLTRYIRDLHKAQESQKKMQRFTILQQYLDRSPQAIELFTLLDSLGQQRTFEKGSKVFNCISCIVELFAFILTLKHSSAVAIAKKWVELESSTLTTGTSAAAVGVDHARNDDSTNQRRPPHQPPQQRTSRLRHIYRCLEAADQRIIHTGFHLLIALTKVAIDHHQRSVMHEIVSQFPFHDKWFSKLPSQMYNLALMRQVNLVRNTRREAKGKKGHSGPMEEVSQGVRATLATTRQLFIEWMLQLHSYTGDAQIQQQLWTSRALALSFKHLANDDSTTVQRIFNVIQHNCLMDTSLSLHAKLQFFNMYNLQHVLRCYAAHTTATHALITAVISYVLQQCQQHVEQQQQLDSSDDDAHNPFTTLFEWHHYDQYETLLLRMCHALQPTESLLQQQQYLQIVQHCPQLLPKLMSQFTSSLQARPSTKFIGSVSLLVNMYRVADVSSQLLQAMLERQVHDNNSEQQSSSVTPVCDEDHTAIAAQHAKSTTHRLDTLLSSILLPATISKSHLTAGLLLKSKSTTQHHPSVVYAVLSLVDSILTMYEKLQPAVDDVCKSLFASNVEQSIALKLQLNQSLAAILRKHLPDVRAVYEVYASLPALYKQTQHTTATDATGTDSATALPAPAASLLQHTNKLLYHVLSRYSKSLRNSVIESKINLWQLLDQHPFDASASSATSTYDLLQLVQHLPVSNKIYQYQRQLPQQNSTVHSYIGMLMRMFVQLQTMQPSNAGSVGDDATMQTTEGGPEEQKEDGVGSSSDAVTIDSMVAHSTSRSPATAVSHTSILATARRILFTVLQASSAFHGAEHEIIHWIDLMSEDNRDALEEALTKFVSHTSTLADYITEANGKPLSPFTMFILDVQTSDSTSAARSVSTEEVRQVQHELALSVIGRLIAFNDNLRLFVNELLNVKQHTYADSYLLQLLKSRCATDKLYFDAAKLAHHKSPSADDSWSQLAKLSNDQLAGKTAENDQHAITYAYLGATGSALSLRAASSPHLLRLLHSNASTLGDFKNAHSEAWAASDVSAEADNAYANESAGQSFAATAVLISKCSSKSETAVTRVQQAWTSYIIPTLRKYTNQSAYLLSLLKSLTSSSLINAFMQPDFAFSSLLAQVVQLVMSAETQLPAATLKVTLQPWIERGESLTDKELHITEHTLPALDLMLPFMGELQRQSLLKSLSSQLTAIKVPISVICHCIEAAASDSSCKSLITELISNTPVVVQDLCKQATESALALHALVLLLKSNSQVATSLPLKQMKKLAKHHPSNADVAELIHQLLLTASSPAVAEVIESLLNDSTDLQQYLSILPQVIAHATADSKCVQKVSKALPQLAEASPAEPGINAVVETLQQRKMLTEEHTQQLLQILARHLSKAQKADDVPVNVYALLKLLCSQKSARGDLVSSIAQRSVELLYKSLKASFSQSAIPPLSDAQIHILLSVATILLQPGSHATLQASMKTLNKVLHLLMQSPLLFNIHVSQLIHAVVRSYMPARLRHQDLNELDADDLDESDSDSSSSDSSSSDSSSESDSDSDSRPKTKKQAANSRTQTLITLNDIYPLIIGNPLFASALMISVHATSVAELQLDGNTAALFTQMDTATKQQICTSLVDSIQLSLYLPGFKINPMVKSSSNNMLQLLYSNYTGTASPLDTTLGRTITRLTEVTKGHKYSKPQNVWSVRHKYKWGQTGYQQLLQQIRSEDGEGDEQPTNEAAASTDDTETLVVDVSWVWSNLDARKLQQGLVSQPATGSYTYAPGFMLPFINSVLTACNASTAPLDAHKFVSSGMLAYCIQCTSSPANDIRKDSYKNIAAFNEVIEQYRTVSKLKRELYYARQEHERQQQETREEEERKALESNEDPFANSSSKKKRSHTPYAQQQLRSAIVQLPLFKEWYDIGLVLTALEKALSVKHQQLPPIITCFVSSIIPVIMNSSHKLRNSVMKFVLYTLRSAVPAASVATEAKQSGESTSSESTAVMEDSSTLNIQPLDMSTVPMYNALMDTLTYHQRYYRAFMFNILLTGLQTEEDAKICHRTRVWTHLMTMCAAAGIDSKFVVRVVQVLTKALQIDNSCQTLVLNLGVIGFLRTLLTAHTDKTDTLSDETERQLLNEVYRALQVVATSATKLLQSVTSKSKSEATTQPSRSTDTTDSESDTEMEESKQDGNGADAASDSSSDDEESPRKRKPSKSDKAITQSKLATKLLRSKPLIAVQLQVLGQLVQPRAGKRHALAADTARQLLHAAKAINH